MSMFSGLGNQISGFVTSKMPGGEAAPADPNAAPPVDPNDPNAVPAAGENGEVPPEGGAMGFAKGLFGKALAVKDGAMQKAGEMGAGNIGATFGGGGGGSNGHATDAEGYEGEEVVEGEEGAHQNGQAGGAMGFAANLMMKARSLKEGVTEKSVGLNLGNVQNMAGGMMSQVTGMIPGMKKEEEVPDVAPQEGEYQEYTEEQQYYQEGQQYQGEYQQEYQQ